MGLHLSTLLACLPCAKCKALTICTIILLRSLAGPGGAFDTPKVKCPPDRGSSDCVTGKPAPFYPSSTSSPSKFSYPDSYFSPAKQPIPIHDNSSFHKPSISTRRIARCGSDLSTPPLTPDDSSDGSVESLSGSMSMPMRKHSNDALDFLMTLFPTGLGALPYAKSISISGPNIGGSSFNGMLLELPGKPKTLYVDAKSAESVSLRESIVALLDLADDHLGCSALVIVLERSSPALGEILHSMMYVGGSVVTKPPFPVDSAFVLVGLEI